MSSLTTACWCGSTRLGPFSEHYLRCLDCETLCAAKQPDVAAFELEDDEQDPDSKLFVGRGDAGPRTTRREEGARRELTDRSPRLLRALLRHKSPPARILELGCRYGSLVALLRTAGFDATGLELSPGLAEEARRSFDIPVLAGPLEAQKILPGSLDAIILADAMENLPDPAQTLHSCLPLLKNDGIFLIQTPRYPEGQPLRELQKISDPFLRQLKYGYHPYLFSQRSIELFFQRLGLPYVKFEPTTCGHFQMCLTAGRSALAEFSDDQIGAALTARPSRRMALALLDADQHRHRLQVELDEFRANQIDNPASSMLGRLKHSLVFRAMRMFGLWEWLELDSKPPDQLKQEHRGD